MPWQCWAYLGTLAIICLFALATLIERPHPFRHWIDNLRLRYSPYWRGYRAGLAARERDDAA